MGDFFLLRFTPLFSKGIEMGYHTSERNPPAHEDRPAHQSEGSKKIHKTPKSNDVISTITQDSFISLRKKIYFPNDLVMKVLARTDRARFPPPGYIIVYESNLRAGLRFPPSLELIDILTICGVSLSQFFYRAMSIVMGLIVLFRDRRVILSVEYVSRMGRLFSDVQGTKKEGDEILVVSGKGPPVSPSKSYIPEDVLKYQCIGHRRAEKLLEINKILNDWNNEFVKVKYLQGKYKKKYDEKVKEMKVVEDQLAECRAELANRITSTSCQNERIDHLHIELVETQAMINQQMRDQQILEAENKKLQSMLSEKEAQQLPSAVLEEFKKSYAFKIIIEDHVQKARNHLYDVEYKTGAEVEGLTPSQASGDPSTDSGGEELESELQQAFSLKEEEDDIDIL
ncbi:hypothetical protein IEQ34_009769 [Dendrobium chrysotoxum]|uniref:Uncharacterized protein n=1 Tax=Dendrobium chrysotoxum TaxID=161865 RepID=A0AAV7GK74_DENCH|nr:hypothetical protein IEQ34_009769 [Dendrobium chrysotoxum]